MRARPPRRLDFEWGQDAWGRIIDNGEAFGPYPAPIGRSKLANQRSTFL